MYELKGHCYVLVRTDVIHPITHERFNFIWYPETRMSLLDAMNYKPYVQSIVTENPWLICMYDREKVRVWDKKRGWVKPDVQTYGRSVNGIMCTLGFPNTISAQVYDGGKTLAKYKKELEKSYENNPT